MDPQTDLYDESGHLMCMYAPAHGTPDLPSHPQPEAGRPPPASRTPDYHLMHHLLHPGGTAKRIGGQLQPNAPNPNPGARRYPENRFARADAGEEKGTGAADERGGEGGAAEAEGCLPGLRKRCVAGGADLMAGWSREILQAKRMKRREGEGETEEEEAEERERARGRAGEKKRREREELKEQLEEARERLQALQEKVLRAFGEKHSPSEEEEEEEEEGGKGRRRGGENGGPVTKRDGGTTDEEEEEVAGGVYDEERDEERDAARPLSLLPALPFGGRRWRGERRAGGDAGGLEGIVERAGMWLGCSGLVRGDWADAGTEGGEGEGEGALVGEDGGGQKFAQALKVELGGAVARVIDRVLRLYAETGGAPRSPPASIAFLPAEVASEERRAGRGGGGGLWMGTLLQEGAGRGEEEDEEEALAGAQNGRGSRRHLKTGVHGGGGAGLAGRWSHAERPGDRSSDRRKASNALPFSSHLHAPHPNAALRPQPLQRPPHQPHPSLLPPPCQPKEPSSFPPPPHPPPPPLSLPLLHYSMQQLFSRALPHAQHLPHLPPSHKDYLTSDPFLEFPSHPSSHPAFPPIPLLGHLDPSLGPRHHGNRGRDRGMRGDMGGLDCGEVYLPLGGTQDGLSPCHLKKAKLMFFYARYPSSNTLKTYFPDVKFNRCVTSQLIKWFSNFREFFYIQMERFARQAVREALTRDGTPQLGGESHLRMSRDTELYRILNMHYNKSNVYQVPEKFIEVAEVALREFYSAIQSGRDSDPCWKKGIYKIICKLDSPVPDTFRLPGCPVG